MLDEIARLRGLVVEAHRFFLGGPDHTSGGTTMMSHGCSCQTWFLDHQVPLREAKAAHAAHVAAILDGGAK